MKTINYNGKAYSLETVSGYYLGDVCESIQDKEFMTDQEFFDAYIKADPSFTELFKYDIDPID